MNFILNHLLITYLISLPVGWLMSAVSVGVWSVGRDSAADDLVWPMSICGGVLWPIGVPLCLAYGFWLMVRTLERFHAKAFPEPSVPTNGCNHPRVAGARFCPRCGRQMTGKGISSRSVVHGE